MIKVHELSDDFRWVAVNNYTENDYHQLVSEEHVTDEMLGYATDQHERGRLEYDAKSAITTIIFDVVTEDVEEGTYTAQVSFMLIDHTLLTFTTDNTIFVEDMLADEIDADWEDVLHPYDHIFNVLYKLSRRYFSAINKINKQRQDIQMKMKKQIQRSVIIQLMDLETTLVYFLTSLKSNNDMLQSLKRFVPVKFSAAQLERLDDIIVEAQQGLEMANIASDIIGRVSNAYSNILDNSLNNTMWVLTIFSIVLTMPNIVFGFFGQNVDLPFMKNPFGWEITVFIAVALCALTIWLLRRNSFRK
ncbi:magnesium transporter CorA family protein [Lactiplantibacillus plantarum]|uniref:magnesium transporter CorA family protein n=1 Tax=Lactiplantibacillus plantarum TaxID=1590 RepID=UPI00189E14C4|nr:magnesium transporter CorA family protein [Lactiplantibacillus plantarum]MCV3761575.1 magnesium transporter CorA family protein [Companilactobacillus farciminis]MDB7777312.1 magnesium transporter CorA family protein [Lactiplantibacillus plantarum]MDB7786289.1 magnesium transporter CorA family protein [Lactiplantibacillus plantarum]MDB7789091.1 magnesium transporter CorA family protein [Lactiplantibacillus plantarum]